MRSAFSLSGKRLSISVYADMLTQLYYDVVDLFGSLAAAGEVVPN